MNLLTFGLTLVLGAVAVLQGVLNRKVAMHWGLAPTVLLNNSVIFVLGLCLYFVVKFFPMAFPEIFRDKASFTQFSWYYLLPGFFGLLFVTGIPFAISRLGALNVFVGLVCTQIVVSLIWDVWVDGVVISWTRMMSAALAVLSVILLQVKV